MNGEEINKSTAQLSLDESSSNPSTATLQSQAASSQHQGSVSTPSTLIKLISKDNKDFPIQRHFAFVATLIRTSLENDPSALELPLPAVRSEVLQKVVEYMQHHKGVEPQSVEKPLRSKIMAEVCKDRWDADFIDRIGENRQLLYDVILAANYLDLKSLLHLGCAKVASLIKGQPLESLKNILTVNKNTDGQNKQVKTEQAAK